MFTSYIPTCYTLQGTGPGAGAGGGPGSWSGLTDTGWLGGEERRGGRYELLLTSL